MDAEPQFYKQVKHVFCGSGGGENTRGVIIHLYVFIYFLAFRLYLTPILLQCIQ